MAYFPISHMCPRFSYLTGAVSEAPRPMGTDSPARTAVMYVGPKHYSYCHSAHAARSRVGSGGAETRHAKSCKQFGVPTWQYLSGPE